jgi:Protein of unknown function (DUF3611)
MTETLNNSSTPIAAKKIAGDLRRAGWVGLWGQLVPAGACGVTLIASILWTATKNAVDQGTNRNTGGGLFLTIVSLAVLFGGVFWFFRYTMIAGKFRDAATRPRKADTIKLVKTGLMINLIGLALAIAGAEALIGSLFAKSLALINPFALTSAMYSSNSSISNIVIQPIDVVVVLANTQSIFAHFLGLFCSLFLLNSIAKQST